MIPYFLEFLKEFEIRIKDLPFQFIICIELHNFCDSISEKDLYSIFSPIPAMLQIFRIHW